MVKKLGHTQRTLRCLRQQGRVVDIAERFIARAGPHGIRKDLFGWIDLVALDAGRGRIVGIQSTGKDFAGHLKKLMDSECTENLIEWLVCGGVAELWAWRLLLVKRGGKAKTWQPRIHEITLEDFGDRAAS